MTTAPAVSAEQYLFLHKKLAPRESESTSERWRTALDALAVFWPAGTVAPDTVVNDHPWVLQVARVWQRSFSQSSFDAASLHETWGERLSAERREALPCWEWPLASLFPHAVRPEPALIDWAVRYGSDGLWTLFLEGTPREVVAGWANSATEQTSLLLKRVLEAGRPGLAGRLVAAGLDPNACNPAGDTALHLTRVPEQVSALLELGADPSATNAQGLTVPQAWENRACTWEGRGLHRLTEVLATFHPDAVPNPHQRLFQMVADAPVADILAAGWAEAVAAQPPATAPDSKGHSWGLLGQVGRTLLNSSQQERRIDLLEMLLSSRVPVPLWTHQSLPGCDDLIFTAVRSQRYPKRKLAAARLVRSLPLAYPTEDRWASAFMTGVAAWRADSTLADTHLKWDPTLLFPVLSDGPPFAAHAGWWLRLPPESTATLAQWAADGILQGGRSYAAQQSLVGLWNQMEQDGDTEGLKPWLPVLVALTYGAIKNRYYSGSNQMQVNARVEPEERLDRWCSLGVNPNEALGALIETVGPALASTGPVWDTLNALHLAHGFGKTLPQASKPKARHRM